MFQTTPEGADEWGVAIVPSILSKQECVHMQKGMWDTLEHLTQAWDTPIHRERPASWREMSKLYPKHSMLHQHGIGDAPFIWEVKQHRACVDVFSKLWQFSMCSVYVLHAETNGD